MLQYSLSYRPLPLFSSAPSALSRPNQCMCDEVKVGKVGGTPIAT